MCVHTYVYIVSCVGVCGPVDCKFRMWYTYVCSVGNSQRRVEL